jgi:hypothetical protein
MSCKLCLAVVQGSLVELDGCPLALAWIIARSFPADAASHICVCCLEARNKMVCGSFSGAVQQ